MPWIDLETWPRRPVHDFFRAFDDPWFNLTAELEAGPTKAWCTAEGAYFSLACWFLVRQAALAEPAFLQRLRPDGRVWQHDDLRLGTTALRPDRTFTYVYLQGAPDFPTFADHARRALEAGLAAPGLTPDDGEDDLLHGTVVPWVRFTGLKHARAGRGGSVPKIALGRLTPTGDGAALPVNVEGHHALIDGVHVGAFLDHLQRALREPDTHLA